MHALMSVLFALYFHLNSVPGGATQLTESPIVKFALMDLSCGFAAVNSLGKELSIENLDPVPNISAKHLLTGGWLQCEVSASYHNRRLVMWEPFIEQWKFEIVFGFDISSASQLHPALESGAGLWISHQEQPNSSRPSPLDLSAERLRDIGKLLRSPFQNEKRAKKESNADFSTFLNSESDFCYLALLLKAQDHIRSAIYSDGSSGLSVSILPGSRPQSWLNQFGFPNLGQNELGKHPMLVCQISDSMPLNINLTGALIENLTEYLSEQQQGKTGHLAPHCIRNISGLVSTHELMLFTALCICWAF